MIFEQLQRLYEAKMYEDVKLLSILAVTITQKNPDQFNSTTRYQIFCYQGDAYYHTGEYHSAINSYKNALQIRSFNKSKGKKSYTTQPMSLTALKGLISLGMNSSEVEQIISQSPGPHNNPSIEWLSNWVQAQGLAKSLEYKSAASLLQSMDSQMTNIDVLAQSAEMYFLSGNYFKAISIRELNPLYYKKLDIYAFLLYQEQFKNTCLEKLASKTSMFPESAVEPWTINGYYNISFNKAPKAIYLAQKALTIEPRNFEAVMMNGIALMVNADYQEALVKFREAIHISPTRYEPHYFVVEIYWKTNRPKEAVACAIEYQRLAPSARSYTLHAVILLKDGSSISFEKARPILEKAIAIDPEHLEAVLLLARVYENSNNCQAAINLLEQCSPKQPSLRYHKMMANLLIKLKNKMKALDHSITAKRICILESQKNKFDEMLFACLPASCHFRLEPLVTKGSICKTSEIPLRFYLSSDEDTLDGEKTNLGDFSLGILDGSFMNDVSDNLASFS
ncbi:hypothetical protein HELRODRAFT_176502 [Helobdella robusta]|uniref:Cell division cycle protein 27 homolog n=1 Tax=Helobdella robusta TaxID=6412 RepID=T1FAL3_HELRO|nr:hypothetical protein HELRODRAFT_176502 [Helobdella robusta]ESN99741.1 hypothetical protein HELRODRAFT_176502 [Helobdella robusta]